MGPGPVGGFTAWGGLVLLGLLFFAAASPPRLSEPVHGGTPPAAAPGRAEPRDFSWDGGIASTACVPSGLGSCVGVQGGASDDVYVLPRDARGALAVTMTWTANATGLGVLRLFVSAVTATSCGDGCHGIRSRVLADADGPSPLVIALPHVQFVDGESVAVTVRPPTSATEPVHVEAWTRQPFHVDVRVRA